MKESQRRLQASRDTETANSPNGSQKIQGESSASAIANELWKTAGYVGLLAGDGYTA